MQCNECFYHNNNNNNSCDILIYFIFIKLSFFLLVMFTENGLPTYWHAFRNVSNNSSVCQENAKILMKVLISVSSKHKIISLLHWLTADLNK